MPAGADLTWVVLVDEAGNPITAANPLDVSGGSGGTSMQDDAAFTAATSSFTPVGGIVTADSVDSGDGGAFAMLANRQQKVTLYDSSGNELSVGGGTQYTEGDTDASITGTAMLMEGAADTLLPVQGTVADGLLVNLGSNNDVTVTGSVTANAGTNLNTSALLTTAAHDAAFGTAGSADSQVRSIQGIASMTPVQVGDNSASLSVDWNGTQPVTGSGNATGALRVELPTNGTGIVGLAAGTNTIGNVGLIPRTSGGMTIFRSIDIDETEEEIKGTAGQVFSIAAFNRTAAPLYLKFYNATAANVSVGTTTPVLTFVVPGNADSDGAGFLWDNPIGFAFGTAITVACTTGVADADTGAPGANDCVVNVGYA